jgi:uncharacterized protein (TIGR00369 family)
LAQPAAQAAAHSDKAEAARLTLAAWQTREAQLRSVQHEHGVARPEHMVGRTGLQFFEAMFSGEIPYPPISQTLSFLVVEASPGHVEFQGKPLFAHYNPLGSVHGGWIATLLDSCVACAVHSTLPAGKLYTTIELKVNFVRALTEGVPLVRAVGQVINVGGRIGTSEGRLVGPDGTLYAHATTTCLIFDPAPPK